MLKFKVKIVTEKISLPKMAGAADKEEMRKIQLEYIRYMEKNNVRPLAMYVPMLCSGCVFTSMFFALREENEIC